MKWKLLLLFWKIFIMTILFTYQIYYKYLLIHTLIQLYTDEQTYRYGYIDSLIL